MTPKTYQDSFYGQNVEGSSRSAAEVIPIVFRLYCPSSLIDIGCRIGAWLAAWKRAGVQTIFGIDGHHRVSSISLKKHDLLSKRFFRMVGNGYCWVRSYSTVFPESVAHPLKRPQRDERSPLTEVQLDPTMALLLALRRCSDLWDRNGDSPSAEAQNGASAEAGPPAEAGRTGGSGKRPGHQPERSRHKDA